MSHFFDVAGSGGPATASLTIPAAGAGLRNVCGYFTISTHTNVNPQVNGTWVLLDGISGSVAFLQIQLANAGINDIYQFVYDGPPIIGSVNTAMTLEFQANVANVNQTVSINGYTY